MTKNAESQEQPATGTTPGTLTQGAVFLLLAAVYLLTAPTNHSLSIDAYSYATMITSGDFWSFEQPRQLLWIAVMQGLYRGFELVVSDPDPFRLIGVANAVQTALAVIVFARILSRDFAQDGTSTWLTAALFASSYGVWRYATEIEVYSTAILLSLLLVHLAFGIAKARSDRGIQDVLPLAVLGGLSTLAYQPLGIVAAAVLPFYLLARGELQRLILYGAVSGGIVVAGFGLAYLFSGQSQDVGAIAYVFDLNELNPARPDRTVAAKVAFAIGHDILSTYWTFGFGVFQDFFARIAPDRFFNEEIYVAERAGRLIWIPVFTFPGAGLLVILAFATALRRRLQRHFSLGEAALLVWFSVHATMMIVLSPAGVEGWIPGVVPLMLVAGLRLVGPCVAVGRSVLMFLLLGVFLVHNGFVGIGIQMGKSGDYLRVRGQALLSRASVGDLIVIASDWSLYKYLLYVGDVAIVQIPQSSAATARTAVDAALSKGRRVFFTDTLMSPPASMVAADPILAGQIMDLARVYQDRATGFATGDAGEAYEINPEVIGQ